VANRGNNSSGPNALDFELRSAFSWKNLQNDIAGVADRTDGNRLGGEAAWNGGLNLALANDFTVNA
jgi:hypothetical protein